MSLTIRPFEQYHLVDASTLVAGRYRELRATVASLPPRYGNVDTIMPMLADLHRHASGVVAEDGGDLVGFLLAFSIGDFRGREAILSPEWANAAITGQSGRIYEAMVATASADWYADGFTSFLPILFADDQAAADTFFRLGFGMLAMDAMRDLSPPQGHLAEIETRCATMDDLDALQRLDQGLCQHLRAAPIFLLQTEAQARTSLARQLADDRFRFFLAIESGESVAFMKIGPATEDASTIIRDAGTASITGAYALPTVRGQGVGNALLARCIDWAREAGYERCGVDFEPANVEANRFWRRHFQPVCFGVQRLLNIG